MKPKIVYQGAAVLSAVRSERGAWAFVWSVWLVMMLAALVGFAKYGRNIPLAEDWLLVSPLTGNEPNLARWVWAQNNEHRIPLPRLILLALLKATHGDFRVGMIFNIIVLGGLAFAMIRVARSLRGGRTSFADAFFPIALLHLGNWENLFWSWQLGLVLPTALTCAVLLVLASHQALARPGPAVVAGISLVLLPLCGASGLVFVPFLALWLGYCGVLHWRAIKTKGRRWWVGGFLIGSAAVALCLTGLYFVGYERPSWIPSNPGLGASLQATIQFLALGFGPVARSSWKLSTMAAIGVLLPSGGVAVLGVLRHKGLERHRALGVLVLFGSVVVFALAMGWGRAGAISIFGGWPIRYVLLAVPILCTAFFVWELYGPTKLRTAVQSGLFLGMCLLLPFNTLHGFEWYSFYQEGMNAVEQDLLAGTPRSILAERHRDFLIHWWDKAKLAAHMQMLHDAGIGPFAQMREDPVKPEDSIPGVTSRQAQPFIIQEIRYHVPEMGEVFLVWGINGWNVVPEENRPAGTEIKDEVMHTPMVRKRDTFVAKVQVPAGVTINYGFLITKSRSGAGIEAIWDGHQDDLIAAEDGVVEMETTLMLAHDQAPASVVNAPLVTQEIRYHMPEAGEVFLVWGINGWNVVPEENRPVGTEINDKVMHTPMVQEGDAFVAKVQVPSGATIDYGFLITEKRGVFDIIRAVWDGDQDYQMTVSEDGVVEVESTLTLAGDLSNVVNIKLYLLVGIGILLVTWLSIFFFSGSSVGEKSTR